MNIKHWHSYVLHLFGQRVDRVARVGMRVVRVMIIVLVDGGRGRCRRRRSWSRRGTVLNRLKTIIRRYTN